MINFYTFLSGIKSRHGDYYNMETMYIIYVYPWSYKIRFIYFIYLFYLFIYFITPWYTRVYIPEYICFFFEQGHYKANWTENGGTSKRLSIVFSLFHGFCYFHFFDVCRRGYRGTGQR